MYVQSQRVSDWFLRKFGLKMGIVFEGTTVYESHGRFNSK